MTVHFLLDGDCPVRPIATCTYRYSYCAERFMGVKTGNGTPTDMYAHRID